MPASTRLRPVELIRAPGVRAIACLAAAAAAIIAVAVMAAPLPAAAGTRYPAGGMAGVFI